MKKLSKQIRRIGLIANDGKIAGRDVVRRAAQLITKAGRTVILDQATAHLADLDGEISPDISHATSSSDLVLVFGGDGTMLRVVREARGARTPILGINVGRLGFLTAVSSQDLDGALEQVWKHDFTLESRTLIEATAQMPGRSIAMCALNDIVISRSAARMIELEVSVNDETLTRYRSDGLIVSSPTGSTAYSLSAGGAIISPTAPVFAITPICPHTLSNRSVIVSLDSTIVVKVISENLETNVTADGQIEHRLLAGDSVRIRRSRRAVRLVHLAGNSFFETVRQKLHWSGSYV